MWFNISYPYFFIILMGIKKLVHKIFLHREEIGDKKYLKIINPTEEMKDYVQPMLPIPIDKDRIYSIETNESDNMAVEFYSEK